MVSLMLACVTFGFATPGVHTGSGSGPGRAWQLPPDTSGSVAPGAPDAAVDLARLCGCGALAVLLQPVIASESTATATNGAIFLERMERPPLSARPTDRRLPGSDPVNQKTG